MEEEDNKWKSVFSKSNEVLYYRNKITGQQKWTTMNCFCPKVKHTNSNLPLSPCCTKEYSTNEKGATKRQNILESNGAARFAFELLSRKVYCLSDIIKEIQNSLLVPVPKKRRKYKKVILTKRKNRGITQPKSKTVSIATTSVAIASKSVPVATGSKLPEKSKVAEIIIFPKANSLKRKQELSVFNGYKLRARKDSKTFGKYAKMVNKRHKVRESGNQSHDSKGEVNSEVKAKKLRTETSVETKSVTSGDVHENEGPQLRLGSSTVLSSQPANEAELPSDSKDLQIVTTSTEVTVVEPQHLSSDGNSTNQHTPEEVPSAATISSESRVESRVSTLESQGESDKLKCITMQDLPTMVRLPMRQGQHLSPITPMEPNYEPVNVARRLDSLQQANIQFISDENLTSGAKFFTAQEQKLQQFSKSFPKNQSANKAQAFEKLESIVDSLKDSSKNTVKGSTSVWTASWLTIILTELDGRKKNAQSKGTDERHGETSNGSNDNLSDPSQFAGAPFRDNGITSISPGSSVSTKSNVTERMQQFSNMDVNRHFGIQAATANGIGVDPRAAASVRHNPRNPVTEIHASFVDLSWRIVTSNGGDSASLNNFYKLIPVREKRCGIGNVEIDDFSFLGVPVHGDRQVIAKILYTTVPQENDEVFIFESPPAIIGNETGQKKVTLSFVWERQAVGIVPKNTSGCKRSDKQDYDLLYPPTKENTISFLLPKPLQLPKAGCKVFLGDFQVRSNDVEFNVSHQVTVSTSPRPHLSLPPGTVVESTSCQTSRCRVQGVSRNDVQTSKSVPVEKPTKTDRRKSKPCSFCGIALYCLKDVKNHRRIHTSIRGIKCSECARQLPTGGRLSVHLDKHKCHLHHICEKCNNFFKTPEFLSAEALSKFYYKLCLNCRKELKCRKCAARFPSLEELHEHTLKRHGLKCRICGESFLYKRDLNKHAKKIHKIANIPPSACFARLSR